MSPRAVLTVAVTPVVPAKPVTHRGDHGRQHPRRVRHDRQELESRVTGVAAPRAVRIDHQIGDHRADEFIEPALYVTLSSASRRPNPTMSTTKPSRGAVPSRAGLRRLAGRDAAPTAFPLPATTLPPTAPAISMLLLTTDDAWASNDAGE
jgi:hypothetical protein